MGDVMNRSQAQEIWFLIKAFGEGVVIQHQHPSEKYWRDVEEISFADLLAHPERHRIKPEPEEIWVNQGKDGSIYVHTSEGNALEGAKGYGNKHATDFYNCIAKRFVAADE